MADDKPFLTLEQLVELLTDERGLVCSNRDNLSLYLHRVSYYRFTGYARQFQRNPKYGDDHFIDDASFEIIQSMMVKDEKLRSLLFKQLSTIEIGIRSVLAHELGRAYGNKAFYLDESNYLDLNNRPETIVGKLASDLARSKSLMISHYADSGVKGDTVSDWIERYRDVPIWVAVEVASFGHISNLIEYFADREVVKAAAGSLSVQWDPFGSVIHSLSVMRNLCCHHRQLWNRTLDIQCPVQKKLRPRGIEYDYSGPYAAIIMANYYREKIDGNTSVANEISALLDSDKCFSEGIYRPVAK